MSALTLFFDFDGVLCKDRFYTTLIPQYPDVYQFISNAIFGGEQKYAERWMRGQFSYHEINQLISEATGIPLNTLSELFFDSVRQMRVNLQLIEFAETIKEKGFHIALVTNNMDIFNEITIPEKGLDRLFPVIVNSFDYGIMKHEKGGRLFDIALAKMGLDSYEDVWLIDDSPLVCTIFSGKGGHAYQYNDQAEFEQWIKRSDVFSADH
jgi:FMN phosphatase YigB (HAD superfamily)